MHSSMLEKNQQEYSSIATAMQKHLSYKSLPSTGMPLLSGISPGASGSKSWTTT